MFIHRIKAIRTNSEEYELFNGKPSGVNWYFIQFLFDQISLSRFLKEVKFYFIKYLQENPCQHLFHEDHARFHKLILNL